MTRILTWSCLVSLLLMTGCSRFAAKASRATSRPVQISAVDVDAAEPVTVSAPDGGFYVAWVNHDANNQSDVMLARFAGNGAANGSPVRVNQDAGLATAWRGDPPSVAVSDRGVYVLWTARVESHGKSGTDLYFSVSHDQGKTFAAPVKVSRDKGRTFSPRTLLMQETVKGTPAVATGNDRAVAIWQGIGAQQPEARVREVGGAGAAISVAANAELPSGVFSKDNLFVAYIAKVGEKRSVWIAKLG